ncbi:MAG: uracil-DNA glycosylase family protein [Neisseria sp.]|nr:uracil-DNA glycosylase family protein [Neisseria sp.]
METQKNQRQTPTRVAPAKPEIAIKTLEQCLAELQGKISAKKLILISLCPSSTNAVARHGFNEQENILLCNMLAAIDLPLENAHLCSWLPHFNVSPNAELLQQHLPRLQAECQLTQAQAVVFIGKFANEANYQNGLAMLPSNAPRFVLPHPARLLAQPHLKADAWQILKKIKSAIQ